MKLHRFIGQFDLSTKHLIVEDVELASQLAKVLRLKSGDEVVLCDGKGNEAKAVIRSLRAMSVSFNLGEMESAESEPKRDVALHCSILKRENFELVAQKATEIGARKIVPILSDRTVKQDLKADRLVRIIKEAAEQSGRVRLPVLEAPRSLHDALEDGKGYDERFFFHLGGEPMEEQKMSGSSAAIYIGPEGGWDESEVALAKESGCSIVSLGSLTLRAETAAIIATYLAVHHLTHST